MLKPIQYDAIALYFVYSEPKKIADKLKVTTQTLRNWKKNKEFQDELYRQKEEFEKSFSRKLICIALKSLDVVAELVDKKDQQAVLKAVEYFLKSKAMDDGEEIKRRLAEIEEQLEK